MIANQDNWRFALITPSYAPDFERCKLLVESVERCLLSDTKQYIIVDRRDVNLFKPLTSSKVHLLIVEDIIPPWIFKVPVFNGWWMSLRTLPVRNWMLQQLVKLSVCDAIDEEVLVFCDSDNAFIRPFDIKSCLMKANDLALLKVDLNNKDTQSWINTSKKILGIEDKTFPPSTYVSNMISWYKPNILKMREHIEETHGTHWIQCICRYKNFSEYMLYGIFVDHILGLKEANHFYFDTQLMKPSWTCPLVTDSQIHDFFSQENIKKSNIGVMIHSKDDLPVSAYADRVRSFWP